ncbi:MAG: UPF0280 family protein [Betaproteobacteria bacterium]|nr:UPF0280 family protein [Betaproteobacteria bacterium]
MNGPASGRLPDGRLHLQHGPIDLVIEAFGEREEVEAAYRQAWDRFQDILQTLVDELAMLRAPVRSAYPLVRGPVAKRMVAAVWPHRDVFITPMAAVAGAVAEEMLEALLGGRSLRKAYVNDGGDIALWIGEGESFRAGVVENIFAPAIGASLEIRSSDDARGIATSGWRGRSQSLGIADAVTVLAGTASQADAAATLIANAVNVEHPAICRLPARTVKEDSDLGELPVTVEVGELPRNAVRIALASGLVVVRRMRTAGLIDAAYLSLQGEALAAAMPPLVGNCYVGH